MINGFTRWAFSLAFTQQASHRYKSTTSFLWLRCCYWSRPTLQLWMSLTMCWHFWEVFSFTRNMSIRLKGTFCCCIWRLRYFLRINCSTWCFWGTWLSESSWFRRRNIKVSEDMPGRMRQWGRNKSFTSPFKWLSLKINEPRWKFAEFIEKKTWNSSLTLFDWKKYESSKMVASSQFFVYAKPRMIFIF